MDLGVRFLPYRKYIKFRYWQFDRNQRRCVLNFMRSVVVSEFFFLKKKQQSRVLNLIAAWERFLASWEQEPGRYTSHVRWTIQQLSLHWGRSNRLRPSSRIQILIGYSLLSCPGCLDCFLRTMCSLLSVSVMCFQFQAEELNKVSIIFSSFLLSFLFDIIVSVFSSSSMLGLAGQLIIVWV